MKEAVDSGCFNFCKLDVPTLVASDACAAVLVVDCLIGLIIT